MAPVPSADQKLKCVSDFNSTWAPNSTGNYPFTQRRRKRSLQLAAFGLNGLSWRHSCELVMFRIRSCSSPRIAGSPICTAEASVSGAGQTLPWALGVTFPQICVAISRVLLRLGHFSCVFSTNCVLCKVNRAHLAVPPKQRKSPIVYSIERSS